jgi:hypothetical protein
MKRRRVNLPVPDGPMITTRSLGAISSKISFRTAPNKIQKNLKGHDVFRRMIYQRRGQKVRAMFDRNNLPTREQQIRNQIKSAGFWIR